MKVYNRHRIGEIVDDKCVICGNPFQQEVTNPFLRAVCSEHCRRQGLKKFGFTESEPNFQASPAYGEATMRRMLAGKIGLHSDYADAVLEDFPELEMPNRKKGVLIKGQNGRGKTHLACAILLSCANDGARCQFLTANMYLKRVRSSYSKRASETEMDILNELLEPDVLVFDDLGADSQTDYGWAEIVSLLEERSVRNRTNIVTTNMALVDIFKAEPRLGSRLRAYQQINLEGDDRRKADSDGN